MTQQPSELEQQLDQVMQTIDNYLEQQQPERKVKTIVVAKDCGVCVITDPDKEQDNSYLGNRVVLTVKAKGSIKKAAEQFIACKGYEILKMDDWSRRKAPLMYSFQVTKVIPKVPTETLQPTKR